MQRLGKFLIVSSICMFLFIPACITEMNPDGTRSMRVDPCAVDSLVRGGDAAVSIMSVLAPFFPFLAPIAAGTAGVVATLRVQKPKLVKAQSREKMYHTVAEAAVVSIENLKKTNPDLIPTLLAEMDLVKNKLVSPGDVAKIENIIRALRGKPAVEEVI